MLEAAGYDSPCLQVDGETRREDLLARGLRPEVVDEIMRFRERLAKKYAPSAKRITP